MECPHCGRILPDTAIRCRWCRRPINDPGGGRKQPGMYFLGRLHRKIRYFLFAGRHYILCPWNMVDVLVMTAVIMVFALRDPFEIASNILLFLRMNFVVATREPRLLYNLTTYINNIIFKAVSFTFLVALVRSRHISFRKTVLSSGNVPEIWKVWIPVFTGICVLFREINRLNPLVPNIPFDSVFPDAMMLGNIVIILAVIFVAPVVEEVVFRGFLYPAFNKYLGIVPSVLLTSFLFTIAHYQQIRDDHVFMVILFSLSFMITWAKARTGSTTLAILMHFIYNSVTVGVGLLDYLMLRY